MKKIILSTIFIIFLAIILFFSVRGLPGNPTQGELNSTDWTDDGPFELSPERGRFALMYSVFENHSVYFSLDIARFATPDVGYRDGKFVSLFAPALSFLIIPGYIIGKYFGVSQFGVFSLIALFGLANLFLIKTISKRLGAYEIASWIAGIIFLFATPAFAYSVALYQHHVSTFVLLLSLYCVLFFESAWSLLIVFLLYGLSLPLDYPNAFFMFPIALTAGLKIFSLDFMGDKISVKINALKFLTLLIIIIPLAFFLWFNTASYGSPTNFLGGSGVVSIGAIDSSGNPIKKGEELSEDSSAQAPIITNRPAGHAAFFNTRAILNGIYIHTISPDRGIVYFTPVILFGILGLIVALRKKVKGSVLLISVLFINVVLYSLWADPWGGWAFGSRYLIPSYAILAIFIGLLLTRFSRRILFLMFFSLVFAYSVLVNALGAITSSKNPPQVEVLGLEKLSGRQEKYSYDRNMDFLSANKSKAFMYNAFASSYVRAWQYYFILSFLILLPSLFLIIFLRFTKGAKANV